MECMALEWDAFPISLCNQIALDFVILDIDSFPGLNCFKFV